MEKLKIRDIVNESYGKPYTHQYYFTTENTIPYTDDDIKDTYVYKYTSDELVHNSGSFISVTLCLDNKFFIVTDKFYDMIEDNGVCDFILYHELGHCKYRHLLGMDVKKSRLIMMMRSLGFLPKIEKEADLYAVSKVGKRTAVKGLYFLIKNTDVPILCKVELFKRLINVAFA